MLVLLAKKNGLYLTLGLKLDCHSVYTAALYGFRMSGADARVLKKAISPSTP